MNLSAHFQTMIDRHYWCLHKLMDGLEQTDADLEQRVFHKCDAPLPLLRHLAGFETFWIPAITGEARDVERERLLAARSVSDLRGAWEPVEAFVRDCVEGLDGADLEHAVSVEGPDGATYSPAVHQVLAQMFIHSGQHIAELALIATELGQSPGDLDFWDYLEQKGTPVPAS